MNIVINYYIHETITFLLSVFVVAFTNSKIKLVLQQHLIIGLHKINYKYILRPRYMFRKNIRVNKSTFAFSLICSLLFRMIERNWLVY